MRVDGANETTIDGAEGPTYTVAVEDIGKRLKVRAEFTDDDGYDEGRTSAATAVIPDTVVPELRAGGAEVDGVTLKLQYDEALNGNSRPAASAFAVTVGGQPATLTGVAIDGDTVTLTLSSAVAKGDAVTVGYTRPAANPVEDLAGNDAGNLSGVTVVNKTSAPPGIPENLSAISTNDSLVFVWSMPQDGGSAAIEGYDYRFALGSSVPPDTSWVTLSVEYLLLLPVATLRRGTEYAFEVRARNLYGRGPAAALTATTTGSTDYPATGAPTISGTVAVRSTLTASTAGIDDPNGVSSATYGFQWFQVDGGSATAIDPETNSRYKVRLADIGKTLKVRVSFIDDGGASESVTSAETAVVPHAENAPPTSRDASLVLSEDGPTYAFKPSDFPFSDEDTGHQLEGILVETPPSAGAMYLNSGRVSSGDDVPLENIEHHSLTYRPDPNHHGTPYGVFTFRVFDGTHHSADAYSFTIDVTAQPDDPTGAPSISGTAKVGETLTADISGIGDVDGLQGAEFAYQWVHVDDDGLGGATETDITGATDAAYTLGDGDLGKRIKVKVSFTDGGGSMHSLPSDVFPQTGSVKAANTPPTAAGAAVTIDEDTPHTFDVAEFNFSDADPGDTLASVTIVSLPAAGSLTLAPAGGGGAGVAVTENQSVAVADIGRLRFTPAANGHGTGYASFDFKVNDGEDDSAQSYTMTVNVTAMNDPPTSAGGTVTIDEDTAHTFDAAEFNFDDADAGDTLASVTIVSLPASGSLTLAPAGGGGAGVAVTENQSVAVADIGRLTFTPAANGNGTGYASFTFKVNDGEDDSAPSYTMTVNVTAVNDPPTAQDHIRNMRENEVIKFTAFRFRYDDIDGDPLASVTILTLPEAGSLTLDAVNAGEPPVAVSANQVISGADLAAGRLKYTPRHNASGSPYASFGFRVNDGTADSPSYTFTINVTDVNEPPTAADSRVNAREDTTYNFGADDFNFSDPDGDALHSVRIISVGGFGGEIRKRPTGTIRPPVTVSAADIDAGNLIFVPDTNEQGSRVKSFRFTVADGSGVSAEYTMTIDVEPVNDPPNSSDKTVTTREDSHHAFTVADFPFSDPDDGDQLESVKILSLPTAGSLAVDAANPDDPPVAVTENQAITRAQLDAGALKFTPEENESGARYATFAFKVNDGEADSPRSRTMTIKVLAVNDPPTSANNRLSANEDEAYRFSLADFSYHDLEEQPLHSVGVLALPERGALWLSGVQLTQGRRVLSADIGRGEFRFSPAANANGAGYASFTFKVSDGLDDSAETYTMTFDVAARNDPPQGLPVIVGQAVANSTVTADTSDITDMDGLVGVAFTYQWIRVGLDEQGNPTETEISTATMSSYAVTDDDGGSFLKVKVTFTDNGGTTASLTSLEVVVGLGNQAPEGYNGYAGIDEDTSHAFSTHEFGFFDFDFDDVLSSVRIVTLPGKGRLMLDAENSADPPRAVVAQQSVSAADIDAGKLRFEPAPNENGYAYTSFTFKVSDGRAEAEQANTFAFDVFPVDDPATGNPVITGTAQVGETLTVDTSAIEDADGLRNVQFEYQWIQVDGGNETEILGADGISYQPIDLDVGKRLKVKVSFSDDEGSYEDLFSAPTDFRTLGTLLLSLDAIAGDNRINIAEKAAGFTIGGETGFVGGANVTVTMGTTELTARSADANPATWSVSVPADASYITGTTVEVEVNASKAGYSAPAAITRSLTVDLTAPTAPSYSAPASLKVREAISAISPSGGIGIDQYSATGLPSGLSIDGTSGVISGTPDTADANTTSAAVTVSDAAGNTATVSIPFPAVAKGDQALSGFQYSASSVPFGSAAPSVTAPSGVRTSLSYSATPAHVCTVHPSTGALTLLGAGICEITATAASSANYNEASTTFTVTVQTAGALVLNLNTIAGDNTVNIAEKTAGFTIGGDTGTEIGVDVTVEIGTGTLTATSADDAGTATWSVSVPADASYITGTSVVVEVNASKTGYSAPVAVRRSLTVDLTAPTAPSYSAPSSLKVGEAITTISPSGGIGIDRYRATGLPSGLTLNTSSGVISGTPDTVDANTTSATVTVSDAAGNSATVSITFPAVNKGDQALSGFQYSPSSVTYGAATVPTVTAPTGVLTTTSYSATPASVCTVDPSSGALTLVGAGICEITATAAGSAHYNEASDTFRVTVQTLGALVLNLNTIAGDNTVNIAEKTAGFTIGGDTGTVGGANVTVTVGTTELTAMSADLNTATWSVSVPVNASYITGTSVVVEVNASKNGYSAPAAITRGLTVDLTAPTAPSYSAPSSLKVGEAIAPISPSGGIGIDRYRATGLPSGLTLNTSSGVISGTPDTVDANTTSATVTVSDAAGNSATVSITFPAVDKGDQALSGFQYSPSSVTYGAATVPTVTAPTGVLTTTSYSATPASVCTVDPSSGALTLVGAGICEITATAAGSAHYNEASDTFTVTVQPAGALVLNLNTIAGDNTVNIAEKTAGFTIGGDTGTVGGANVTVTVGTTELTAMSADLNTATWSVSVPVNASYITGTSVVVEVNASKNGYSAPAAITRGLTVDLTAPTAPSYSAPSSLKVGEAISAISPSGGIGIDQYSATGLPSGLTLNTSSGVISGTPDTVDTSTTSATVTVSDTAGNSATVSITFPAVNKGDQALSGFQYSPSSVTYGAATVPTVTAPTGVLTTISYSATPASVCTVDPSSGALTLVGAGICEITATAAGSAHYNEASDTFTVTVQPAGALVLNLNTIAGDNTVNIAEKTAGFTIGGDTGTEIGVDVTVEIGTGTLTATSADDAGTATWSVSVPANASYITGTSVVVEVNASKNGYSAPAPITRGLTVDLTAPTAPSYSAPSSLKVGEAISAISPSGGIGIDQYSATGLPSGLTLNTSSGVISGTPDTVNASTTSATVTVSDTPGNSATVSITFPAVDKGDQALSGFQYSASSVTFGAATVPTVTAPTGVLTTISYSATPAEVCTVDPSSGALTLVGAGVCEITATAAGSAHYNEAGDTFTVTVQPAGALVLNLNTIAGDNTVNIAEKTAGFTIGGDTGTVGGANVTVTVGTTELTAMSADLNTATWSVSVPVNASYITGTSVVVEVNASKNGYSAPAPITRGLTVDLTAPTAPSYSAPSSLKVGEAIAPISPSGGSGIDQYSATGLPSGLTLNTSSGVISGTPDTVNANTTSATVTVSDTPGNSAMVSITFPAVNKGDQALSGFQYSPSSVTYGAATVPTVTAPTGVLTTTSYSATPASVCTVDPSSGALTLVGAGICEITATAAGSAHYNEASDTFTVTVQPAGALVLNLNTIAGDNTVNIAEKTAGFTIGGDTGTVGGANVTVTVGTTELTAMSADLNTATWSVSVPADASYITGTSVVVEVNASKNGYSAPAAITRGLTVDLTAPTAPTYSAPSSLKVGEAISAISPSGGSGIDQYSATGLPSGLSIDDTSGVISGTPDTVNASTTSATVTVSDTPGNSATVSITFPAVDKGDQALSGFQYSASSVTYGAATVPTVTAPTGVLTTISYSATPAEVCTVDPSSGALTLVGAGICEITATAAGSAHYNEAGDTFTVTVQPAGALVLNLNTIAGDNTVNIAEKTAGFTIGGDTGTVGGANVTVTVGTTELTAMSADLNTATWSVSVPVNASYITGTSVVVEVNASKNGYSAPAPITRGLTVDLTAPTAPSYSAPSSLKVGEAIAPISPSGGIGIDRYRATGLPSGLSIDDTNGVISGTPDTVDANTTSATVSVSDTPGNSATVSITFPAVDKGDQALSGFQYSASSVTFGAATVPTVTAPTGVLTTISYSATPAEVCTVDPSSGALTLVGAGICEITATAAGSDHYNEAGDTFTVTVQPAGALVLNLNTIAGDNTVNIAEKTAGFTIGGDTGTEIGVDVTVEIGTGTLTATSADDAGTATWSVSVPADASYITGTSVVVEVNASKTGYSAPAPITRGLTVDLTAPTAPSYSAPSSLKVGEAIAAISPSGGIGIDQYSATGLPSGLSIDDTNGAISGTPDTVDANTTSATVTVSDTAGNSATVTITFPAVNKGDQALSGFQYSPSSVTYGAATVPTVTAPTGVLTTTSYTATPASVCTVDPSSGALTLVGAGICVITATAAGSAHYNEAGDTFTVTVQPAGALVLNLNTIAGDNTVNIAEKTAGFTIGGDTGTVGGANVTVTVGTTELTAPSADADPATWSVSVPANASYITGTSVVVEVNASKNGYSAPAPITRGLTVDLTAPTAPSYSAPSSLKVGEAISAISPSGGIGIDQYSATGLPSGLTLNTSSGVISGTPDTVNASTTSATVTVSDTAGNSATVSITFPAVNKGDQALSGFQYSASSVTFGAATVPTVTAPTGVLTTISYSATPAEVCTVDPSSGALTLVGAGICEITATAAGSAHYNEASDTFTVTVQPAGALVLNLNTIAGDNTVNIAEKTAGFTIGGDTGTVGGANVTVTVGTTELTAMSADLNTATWSVSVPVNASYITGTSVVVEVNASKNGYSAPAAITRGLTVDLTAPTAPSYSAPSSLKVGEAIAAISPSGGIGIDRYRATGLPSGLSIDDTNGVISGTPDTVDANTTSATVSVSDTPGNSATVSITFPAVDKGDQALSGFQYSASSVTFGAAAPSVTAPSGVLTTLSYTATPASVCTVDPSSGALTLVGAGICEITATAAGSARYNGASATFTVTVQPAGALVLNLNTIAGDNTVNIAEKTAGFTIGGDTGTEIGVDVTVEIGTGTLTATSADDAGTATWSVSVPADASYITGTSVVVEVNASKTGYSAPAPITRGLTVDLTAPTAPSYSAPSSLKVGEAISAISPSGGIGVDQYSATGLPSGLSIDDTSGAISGTPDTVDANTTSATVTVSDAAGNSATVSITFPAVDKGDQALSGFQYSPSSVTYGAATVPTVTAPTGVLTTTSYTATPSSVCTVDPSSGALTLVDAGICEITATAAGSDAYNEATATFTVTVQTLGTLLLSLDAIAGDNRINIAEKAAGFTIGGDTGTVGGANVTVTVGTTELTAPSADADPATWSVSVPADASYITGTSVEVEVNASKTGYGAPAAITRGLTVDLTAPTAPTYSAPASLKVGEAISAISPSGGSGIDQYSATDLPSGLSIDDTSGAISGAPDTADADTTSATVTVSDTPGNSATVSITFPAVDKGDQALSGFQYSASSVTYGAATVPTVTAPTGVLTTTSYSATPAEVCTVDPSSGALSLVDAGICEITATAAGSDHYNEASDSYTVTVQAAGVLVPNFNAIAGDNAINIAEKADGFDISGDTGSVGGVSVTVTVGTTELTAISADADPAIWSVSVPADASYITGTIVVVEVNASKNGYTTPVAVRRSLTVDLTGPTAPSYSAPSSLQVGEAISAMNPSGGSGIDEYSGTGLPSGLSIDDSSGVISGTPDTVDANTTSATVTVSDAAGNTATVSMIFPAVDKGDQVLSGFQYSASSVKYGAAAPSVTAPSGVRTSLSYSAAPAEVCRVHPSTGALTLLNAGICEIIATAASSANYNETSTTYTVTVREVETTLTVNTAAVDEHGGGTRVTVTGTLDGVTRDAPTTFTVSVGASNDAATEGSDYVAVSDLILTIPSGETSGAVTFTLTAIDDFIDEPDEALSITGTSQDAGFEVIGTTLSITDNDERGVQISPTSLTVPEGGDETYTVVLTSQPTGEVTVTPSLGSGDTDVTVSAALTFTETTWNQAQTVTVSAAQDADAANDTATIVHAVSGADYEADSVTADDVSVAVDDDETALTLTVNPSALDEHGGDTRVTVTGTLDGVTRDVPTTLTVTVGASDDAAIKGTDYAAVNVLSLTIPSGQASGTATFTLTAIDDFIDERVEAVSITGTIQDAGFEVIGTTLSITDNDERGVQISPTSLTVPEGGDETYTVVLTSQPTGEVTVTPSLGSGDTDVTVSAALTFTETTWNQAQTVTVSAAQDADAANDTATIVHAVSGADYGANSVTADDVSVAVDDDETALTLTVNPAALDEHGGGTRVTVTGTLDGVTRDVPTTLTVTVGASDDAAIKGTDYAAVNVLSLTIPSGQASGTATFTLTAIDDFIDERVEAVSITGTIQDAGFEVIGTTLSITDNDERGVQISPTSLTVPEGGDETYTVVLTSQPTGEVTVTPSLGSGDTDVTVSAALTFTETTWNQAQTVTVSAAQDADAANDTATIVHAVSGADYGANSVTADDVSVAVDDDETALTLTVNPAALDEHGGGTRVTVTGTLDGVTRDVPTTLTVTVGASDDAAIKGTDYAAVNVLSLTIPSGQASGTAIFTLTAIDDFIDERVEAVSITGTIQDAGFEVIGTTLSITDNDERRPTSLTVDATAPDGDAVARFAAMRPRP